MHELGRVAAPAAGLQWQSTSSSRGCGAAHPQREGCGEGRCGTATARGATRRRWGWELQRERRPIPGRGQHRHCTSSALSSTARGATAAGSDLHRACSGCARARRVGGRARTATAIGRAVGRASCGLCTSSARRRPGAHGHCDRSADGRPRSVPGRRGGHGSESSGGEGVVRGACGARRAGRRRGVRGKCGARRAGRRGGVRGVVRLELRKDSISRSETWGNEVPALTSGTHAAGNGNGWDPRLSNGNLAQTVLRWQF
jgi:hypothetical protein